MLDINDKEYISKLGECWQSLGDKGSATGRKYELATKKIFLPLFLISEK